MHWMRHTAMQPRQPWSRAAWRTMLRMILSSATMSEPRQIDPKLEVSDALSAAVVGSALSGWNQNQPIMPAAGAAS